MVWEVKTYPWQDPQKSFTSNSVRNHLRVGDLQLFDLIGAFLNVSEEEMSIRMSRAAAPYWVSFNHNKIVAQLCNGWRAPYAESVLKAVHEDYFALTCGQSQHFWRRGDSGNLSDTRDACKVIEHFMYCESSVWPGRKAQDINFSTPLVPATAPGGGKWLSTKGSCLGGDNTEWSVGLLLPTLDVAVVHAQDGLWPLSRGAPP